MEKLTRITIIADNERINNMNIYEIRRYGKIAFLVVTALLVVIFLRISNDLVSDLSRQERERMEIWADATKKLSTVTSDPTESPDDIEFLLDIIRRNNTIPVLLTDGEGNILDHRNFDLPEPIDSLQPFVLSAANEQYLRDKLSNLKGGQNVIIIAIADDDTQYLYYEDSKLLKRLSLFPYLELIVMIAFICVGYYAVSSTKRAEQNKVWVGLSKETAHQLGTPISSLMAWMEYLESAGIDSETVKEMNKDVARLSTIASRFSKIGSAPTLEEENLNYVVSRAAAYMQRRISSRIKLSTGLSDEPLEVRLSSPLLEWVLENLIKNAVDAMEGSGSIDIVTSREGNNAVVDISDTGKGISRKHQKTVFNPGFTTKKRGWGLGLTLAKRIIEQYHSGRIYVLRSEPGVGTTFRIQIPVRNLNDK